MLRIDELKSDYLHEYLPNTFSEASVEEIVALHHQTKDTVNKEYAETIAMGKALIDRMTFPDDAPRPSHPLEECIEEVHDVKAMYDELWEDREERLHTWKHGEDYGEDVKKVWGLKYTND